jgi:hypothetical protein
LDANLTPVGPNDLADDEQAQADAVPPLSSPRVIGPNNLSSSSPGTGGPSLCTDSVNVVASMRASLSPAYRRYRTPPRSRGLGGILRAMPTVDEGYRYPLSDLPDGGGMD